MRLLYIQQLLILPGQAGHTRSWEMALRWHQTGHPVTFLTSTAHLIYHPAFPKDIRFPFVWEYEGISIHVLDVPYQHEMPFYQRIRAFLRFYRQAIAYAKKMDPVDAVVAYTAPLSVAELGKQVSQALGKPYFLEVADVWPEVPIGMGIIRNPWLIAWLRRRTRHIYAASSLIFPFSPDMVAQITVQGVEAAKVHLALPGTSLRPSWPSPYIAKRASPAIRLIYTGTVGQANDLSQVVQAFAFAQERTTIMLRLDIIGSGNDLARVKAYAEKLSCAGIHFQHKIPKESLGALWQAADMAIVSFAPYPVLAANAAAKLFDYLAAGLPVLINYGGWQASLLRENGCGLSSEQGNYKAFARNILFLAHQKIIRDAMSRKARLLAQAQFDRQAIADQMMAQMVRIVPDRLSAEQIHLPV